MSYYGSFPDNDYRNYLEHGTKGKRWTWKNHKYTDIVNGVYVYAKDKIKKYKAERKRKKGLKKARRDMFDMIALNGGSTWGIADKKRKEGRSSSKYRSIASTGPTNTLSYKINLLAAKFRTRKKKKKYDKSLGTRITNMWLKSALGKAWDRYKQRKNAANQRKEAKKNLPNEEIRMNRLKAARADIKKRYDKKWQPRINEAVSDLKNAVYGDLNKKKKRLNKVLYAKSNPHRKVGAPR